MKYKGRWYTIGFPWICEYDLYMQLEDKHYSHNSDSYIQLHS